MTSQTLSTSSPDHHEVCTWWHAYGFDNPLRKLVHSPRKVLGAYVEDGMTVMDVGCGMGHFAIGMARLVGISGRVIAVDLQQKMLDVMLKRARRAGVADRICPHPCEANHIGVTETVDFILAFWMVHEVGDQKDFFNQLKSVLAPGGKILMAEPRFHVNVEDVDQSIKIAETCGLHCIAKPNIRFSLTALLEAA
ncbi:MAG: class I SAM-dependent methyltransferase [Deltaproteobacteria bacterium]|jgi:ubiquinone/menaquinone biosynthesis C-methylase UbiE|nr:class I SAM-dependent methyltransferase [Deltaproteobacteria bacterium]